MITLLPRLVHGDPQDQFTVDPRSGRVAVAQVLDREMISSYGQSTTSSPSFNFSIRPFDSKCRQSISLVAGTHLAASLILFGISTQHSTRAITTKGNPRGPSYPAWRPPPLAHFSSPLLTPLSWHPAMGEGLANIPTGLL